MREHETEPVPGLPETLPVGESILWQGAPRWSSLAKRVFHIRGVSLYLALIVGWGASQVVLRDVPATTAAVESLKFAALASAAIGALLLYAYLIARTTLYTLTNKRFVMRFGVALPITLNIPLSAVQSADLRLYGDGTGDIPLLLNGKDRQSLVVLWPHVRPWHVTKPQPMLRSVPAARGLAEILSSALTANASRKAPTLRIAAISPVEIPQDGRLAATRETVAA